MATFELHARNGRLEIVRRAPFALDAAIALLAALAVFAFAAEARALSDQAGTGGVAWKVGGVFLALAVLGGVFRRRRFHVTLRLGDGGLEVERRDFLSTAHAPVLRAGEAQLLTDASGDTAADARLVLLLPDGRRLALTPWTAAGPELDQARARILLYLSQA